MFKKVFSILIALSMLCCLFMPVAYANDVDCDTAGHIWADCSIAGFNGAVDGFPVSVTVQQCTKCKLYKHQCKVLGLVFNYISIRGFSGLESELTDWLAYQILQIVGKNATASEWQAGGGSASPGGVGRHPAGYESDEGVPSVGSNGVLYVKLEPYGLYWNSAIGFNEKLFTSKTYDLGLSGSGTSSKNESIYQVSFCWKFVAPVSGIYYLGNTIGSFYYPNYSYFSKSWYSQSCYTSIVTSNNKYLYTITLEKGETGYFYLNGYNGAPVGVPYKFSFPTHSNYIACDLLGDTVNKQTNITINNNTWNGNIYVDSSTNLTYIYPQYTTVNENNETITEISKTAIIYNSETNKYYTYDEETKTFYEISFSSSTPTPDPSPSPSPTPDPDNPDTPTPTPTPGGDSSGGNSSSGGGSTFNPFQWLADLLKDVIEGIFKLLWNLVGTLFGFVLWLLSLLGKLFPFLPDGCALALSAGVIIVLILKIIKFILGR